MAEASRKRSASGRDVGPLPAVVDPARKAACALSLRLFCESYFPLRFDLRWGEPHLRALARMERCVLHGGLYALALPRASGKTTMAEAAALWGVFYGYRKFVVILAATADRHAGAILDSLKAEIENNDLLYEDFPEICHPVRRLEGIANRAPGQTLDGRRTHIEWTGGQVVLPTVKGAPCSGAVLMPVGITGSVRGLKLTGADGRAKRPDLVLGDDPQTAESARSAVQNAARESVIKKDVLGLAGPKKKIAALLCCTVVEQGDLADRMLDTDRNPEWQGERTRLLVTMPAEKGLWDRYAALRADSLRAGGDGREATEYYAANRAAMDAGAEVSWPERYNADELSAIQHAMNLLYRDEAAFWSEYQNEPLAREAAEGAAELDPDAIMSKLSGVPRGVAPEGTSRVTAGIDVQGNCLYWMVCGWREDFGGAVIDYGVWPRQARAYFAARDCRPDLAEMFPDMPEEARIYAGLVALSDELAQAYGPERTTVDAGWGKSTDAVYQFCRQHRTAGVLCPSHGRGITAGMVPMRESKLAEGERRGWEWKLTGTGKGRHLIFDTNAWKSFLSQRLLTPEGGRGSLALPGSRPAEHQLLADHLCAEYRVATEGRGRRLEEWKIKPNRPDNHWLDCLVLCGVGASVAGLAFSPAEAAGQAEGARPRGAARKWSDIQKSRRRG